MKRYRMITCLVSAAFIAASFAGCGSNGEMQETEKQEVSAPQQERERQAPQDQRRTIAKVISLDGDQLTVILAEKPERSGGSGPESISGVAIDSPGAPPGGPGQGGSRFEFTGEEVTYTLSGDVNVIKITAGSETEIDLSELAAGDVIRFTTATDEGGNELLDTILIME